MIVKKYVNKNKTKNLLSDVISAVGFDLDLLILKHVMKWRKGKEFTRDLGRYYPCDAKPAYSKNYGYEDPAWDGSYKGGTHPYYYIYERPPAVTDHPLDVEMEVYVHRRKYSEEEWWSPSRNLKDAMEVLEKVGSEADVRIDRAKQKRQWMVTVGDNQPFFHKDFCIAASRAALWYRLRPIK